MNDLPILPNGTDTNLEQVVAREHYEILRKRLITLQSAPEPDMAAIDGVIQALSKAQMAYKATHGLIGNNADDDKHPYIAPPRGPVKQQA
jgi:hypothetical protein